MHIFHGEEIHSFSFPVGFLLVFRSVTKSVLLFDRYSAAFIFLFFLLWCSECTLDWLHEVWSHHGQVRGSILWRCAVRKKSAQSALLQSKQKKKQKKQGWMLLQFHPFQSAETRQTFSLNNSSNKEAKLRFSGTTKHQIENLWIFSSALLDITQDCVFSVPFFFPAPHGS